MISELLFLFGASFLAATLFPAQSELVLVHLLLNSTHRPMILLIVATVGNTLGSCVNWGLGRLATEYQNTRWWSINPAKLANATALYQRFGVWTLLFSWLPIIGDGFTLIAGLFKTPFGLFVLLAALGKAARYGVIIWTIN